MIIRLSLCALLGCLLTTTPLFARDFFSLTGKPILILGSLHQEIENSSKTILFDPDFEKAIQNLVIPRLENDSYSKEKTIILFEGIQTGNTRVYGSFTQSEIQSYQIDKHIPKSLQKHAGQFVLADYRKKIAADFDFYNRNKHCFDYEAAGQSIGVFDLMKSKLSIRPNCLPSNFYPKALEHVYTAHSFELHYIKVAQSYAKKGYKVIVIVGAGHAARYVAQEYNNFPYGSFDYFIPSKAVTQGFRSARKFLGTEEVVRSHYRAETKDLPWLDWQNFYFSPNNLPREMQNTLCKSFVLKNKKNLTGYFKEAFPEAKSLIGVRKSCFPARPSNITSGNIVSVTFKDGQEMQGQYMVHAGIIDGDDPSFYDIQFNYDTVEHTVRMEDLFWVVLSETIPSSKKIQTVQF